jgi:cytochrome c biogenesis protein CcdA
LNSVDVKCPICGAMNESLNLEETDGWMEFGAIYSISLTPCVGAFLGSALMLASSAGGALKGATLLLT